MSNQNEKQNGNSAQNSVGSGSEYHKEHAGNVEGYGQPHPVNGEGSMSKENEQTQ
ncbi:hypothetical protein ABES03_03385 [Neobacillus rhizosphaerae]|uniref:hypothetical protein n=1 Tax=Neobacillus rhizosphaerae TaxID=2880965 RepID=UPI003D2A7825